VETPLPSPQCGTNIKSSRKLICTVNNERQTRQEEQVCARPELFLEEALHRSSKANTEEREHNGGGANLFYRAQRSNGCHKCMPHSDRSSKTKRPYIHIIPTLLENWFIRISRTHFLYRLVSIVNTINKK
jgi:hypothetical protein